MRTVIDLITVSSKPLVLTEKTRLESRTNVVIVVYPLVVVALVDSSLTCAESGDDGVVSG